MAIAMNASCILDFVIVLPTAKTGFLSVRDRPYPVVRFAPRDARQLASQRMIVGIWGNPVFALRQPRHVGRNPPCLIPDSNFAADRRPQLPLCA
jgi:hypothetical protein